MAVAGGVVGSHGVVALHKEGRAGLCAGECLDLVIDLVGKAGGDGQVADVRATGPLGQGEGVLAGEGGPGHGMKAPGGQGQAQLREGVVIVPVAVADHGDGESAAALDGRNVLDEQVGHPPGVDRGAEDHQVPSGEGLGGFADVLEGEVEGLHGTLELLGQAAGDLRDHFFGGVGGAEIGRPDGVDLHGSDPLSVLIFC